MMLMPDIGGLIPGKHGENWLTIQLILPDRNRSASHFASFRPADEALGSAQ
jgi:hypothetical protein